MLGGLFRTVGALAAGVAGLLRGVGSGVARFLRRLF